MLDHASPAIADPTNDAPPGPPLADLGDHLEDEDLCDMLLAALVAVASKSKRRQADLAAAIRRARIEVPPARVTAALVRLEAAQCVREPVPLYDGGLLITVTNMGMDLLGRSAHWRFLQTLSTPQG